MPLHLLGKKSWNVYNADNIARVKADEAAAAAREAADDQRMQELDAERRAAILRGRTPPPLPEPASSDGKSQPKSRGEDGRERKRRKLAGEDDTDMDIRLASNALPKTDADDAAKILKIRSTVSDAPLTDHAGHIDLFPVDMKEAIRREKNAEVEKEKRKKEKALEDQYTMRFSNAAGRGGISQPWYIADQKSQTHANTGETQEVAAYSGFEVKDVWGNEDPRRKERQQARISTSDPFAFMQKAQAQLQRSKLDKKKWAEERDRELRELRATQEHEERLRRHRKRKSRHDGEKGDCPQDARQHDGQSRRSSRSRYHDRKHDGERERSSKNRHRDRSHDRDRSEHRHSHRKGERSRSRSRDRIRHDTDTRSSSHRKREYHRSDEPSRKAPERTGGVSHLDAR
ncbi:hypothetical protein NX059_004954 [Plenodomus lindquistii]|nr:hypothetical protein NX059_004954 [Plenodomus lindquistii]